MNTFSVLILVCSLSTPGPDCSKSNAIDVIRGPVSTHAATCGMNAQAMVAPTDYRPAAGQYLKVVCKREAAPVVADSRPAN